MPETPFAEFIITGAGPATNILLSLVLALLLAFWLAPQFGQQLLTAPWRLTSMLGGWNLTAMVFLLLINNITLALFNLVPAFPMDGGRLLRSLLATFLPFTVATNLAAWVGQGMAVLMLIVALLQPSLIVMALVAVFILLAAGQERRMVASQHFLRGYSVRQAMQRVGARLHPLQTLAQAAEQMIGSSQSVYLVVDGGKLMGVLSRGDVLAGLRKAGPATRVGQQMTRDILRLSPNESLAGAYDKLLQNNVWLAIVVEDGQVVGTLSQSDLSRLGDLLKAHPGLLAQE
jgi:CBS domain-containing protein